jgi:hypothetical protein
MFLRQLADARLDDDDDAVEVEKTEDTVVPAPVESASIAPTIQVKGRVMPPPSPHLPYPLLPSPHRNPTHPPARPPTHPLSLLHPAASELTDVHFWLRPTLLLQGILGLLDLIPVSMSTQPKIAVRLLTGMLAQIESMPAGSLRDEPAR